MPGGTETAGVRRALLIGVGQAPATQGVLEQLDEVVEADLRLMRSALDSAGYEVEVLHDPGLNRIRPMIYEAARDVPEGGTLLLYFTGHGVRTGGRDYLVPADAIPPRDGVWLEPYVDSLLPADISALLKDCRAGTVLWIIDACRALIGGDQDGVAFGNSIEKGPPAGGFAVLTGCSEGERCGHTAEGSFFTRGLADALGPLTPARSVHEVFTAARTRTREAARRHGLIQTADIAYGTNAKAATQETEICSGRPLLEAWQEAARETPLWDRVRPEDRGSVPAFKTCLDTFVEQCARTLHHAQERLPHPDPWADEAFPVRLLRDRLPLVVPGTPVLSAIEVTLLVAAPFLHEAAWADRLSQSAEIDPYDLERRADAGAHRRHYEQIGFQHARVARKVAQCRARGRLQDETAVTMWLVHRWIADRFETDDEAVPASRAHALFSTLGAAPDRVRELSGLLCELATGIGLDDLQDELLSRSPRKVVLPGGHQLLRIRPLWALLRLATCLAVDVRTFPEVVGEHLAVTDPVLPEHVLGVTGGLSWDRDDGTLDLDAPCPHQAVHAALSEVVERADCLAAQVKDLAGELPEAEAALLAAVPTRVTERGLRPRETGGDAPYEIPLLRFHLAQTEVRELLMGEQLYGGEPHLALRELYQNAMDACRYRAMRWRYLESSGARPAPWTGEIVFTQGEDERGRYVECRDNGVGMSAEALTHTFTQAGSRFERSKSFRKEQSRWLRHDPSLRLYPNSRFGIGVFSYFMLADEMTIVTRHVSPDGEVGAALRVDIPSSGSLFRIQRHTGPDDGVPEGGTRVRLYLREGESSETLSSARVLRELVRVSEFRMEVREEGATPHVWKAGTLEAGPGTAAGKSLEAVAGTLWWVDGEGAILCDGVTTDQKPFGYVLNLTGAYAGTLSVSRNELQDFDGAWADAQWRKGAEALAKWSELSYDWLWGLDEADITVARVLDQEWRGKDVAVRRPDGSSASLDAVGWFRLDGSILRGQSAPYSTSVDVFLWRRAVHGLTAHGESGPVELIGHPAPHPGDTLVSATHRTWYGVVKCAAQQQLSVAEVLRRMRSLRLVDVDQSPPPMAGGDPDWVPDVLDSALALTHDRKVDIGGSLPLKRHRKGDRTDYLSGLVVASRSLGVPLGKLARHLDRYSLFHTLHLDGPPSHHERYVCTGEDINLLFTDDIMLRRVSTARDVREVCAGTGATPEQVLETLTAFGWLGWTAPDEAEVAGWMTLDEKTAAIVSRHTVATPAGRRTLSWGAVFELAHRLKADLRTAEQRLVRIAADLNLDHLPRYADGSPRGLLTASATTANLVEFLARRGHRLEDGLDVESITASPMTKSQLTEVIPELAEAGVAVPGHIRIAVDWTELSLRSQYSLSGKSITMNGANRPAVDLTSAVLFSAAVSLNEPLRHAWDLAREKAPRYGLSVPSLPPDLAEIQPSFHSRIALVTYPSNPMGESGTPQWRTLTAAALAKYARTTATDAATAYEYLAAFRALGALVPDLPPPALDRLRGLEPDDRDLLALSDSHRVSPADVSYTPLDLVSIAGRLGEPITETVRRITPYLPLLPGDGTLPPAPATIPLWQDLALLSQCFDGRLPAVQGTVTARHIQLAAAAVGETETWIRERLRVYATMFDLELFDLELSDLELDEEAT